MTPDYWICAECGRTVPTIDEHAYQIPVKRCHLDAKTYPVIGGRVDWRRVR